MASVGDLNDLPELRASMEAEKGAGSKLFVYPADFHVNIQTRMGIYVARLNDSSEDDAYKALYHVINFIREDKENRIVIPDELYWGFVRYYRSRVVYNPDLTAKPKAGTRAYEGNIVSLYQLQRILRVKEAEEQEDIAEIIIRGFIDVNTGQWVESLLPAYWAKMRDEVLWELEKFQYPIEHIILYALEARLGDYVEEDEDDGYVSDLDKSKKSQAAQAKKIKGGWVPPDYADEEDEEDEDGEEE